MIEVLFVALALVLGFLVGLRTGVVRVYREMARRRAMTGASAGFARLWPQELPLRSAADIIAGRIRVVLGGTVYELPVLSRAESRRWLESLDARFVSLAGGLAEAGNDTERILTMLMAEVSDLYEMLLTYDQRGVLPPRAEIDEIASDVEILRAVIEVWRAVNPLAAMLAAEPPTSGSSPEPSSTPQQPMAGASTTSSAA